MANKFTGSFSAQIPKYTEALRTIFPALMFATFVSTSSPALSDEPIAVTAQQYLAQLGYEISEIDGRFGGKSKTALKEFLNDHNEKYDGKLDSTEIEKLKEAAGNGDFSTKMVTLDSADGNVKVSRFTYEEIENDIYNPDRGFYRDFGNSNFEHPMPTGSCCGSYTPFVNLNPSVATSPIMKNGSGYWLENAQPLRMEWLSLSNFYNDPLSEEYLTRLEDFLGDARKHGYKLILRWAYTFPNEVDDPNYLLAYDALGFQNPNRDFKKDPMKAPDEAIILQHVHQLSTVVNRNKDVISIIQFGMLGAWGEWHSDRFGDYRNWHSFRSTFVKEWLDNTSDDVFFALRYPPDYGKAEISNLHGFDRIGLHDDCPSGGDFGMMRGGYSAVAQTAPLQTGEMCNADPVSDYSCKTMMDFFEKYHYTALRFGYPEAIFDGWYEQGCMNDIRKRLGYRLVLLSSAFDGHKLKLQMVNKGFAADFRHREFFLKIGETTMSANFLSSDLKPGVVQTFEIDLQSVTGISASDAVELFTKDGVMLANTTGNVVRLK